MVDPILNNGIEERRIYYEIMNNLRKCHRLASQLNLRVERLSTLQQEILEVLISVTTLFYLRFHDC